MEKPTHDAPVWQMFEFIYHRLDQFDMRLDERDRDLNGRFTKLWVTLATALMMMLVGVLVL